MSLKTSQRWYISGGDVPAGLTIGQRMFWPYPQGGTCEEVEAAFLATSVPDRLAVSKPDLPASAYGYQLKNCGTPSISDDWRIKDPGDGTGGLIYEDGSSNPNPNPQPDPVTVTDASDRALYKNLGISQSSQNVP